MALEAVFVLLVRNARMSAPNPAFKDLFPPTHYPLLRLLGLFIDLYQVMQADPSEDFTDAYQDWFEEWWNFWTREFGGLRTPIAAFYATRWWRLTADDERGRMCAMLENYIAEARRGRLEPHMLVRTRFLLGTMPNCQRLLTMLLYR